MAFSGIFLAVNASTHTVGAITYRMVDKEVQEDARKIFDGTEFAAMFASKSFFREDLMRNYLRMVPCFNVVTQT